MQPGTCPHCGSNAILPTAGRAFKCSDCGKSFDPRRNADGSLIVEPEPKRGMPAMLIVVLVVVGVLGAGALFAWGAVEFLSIPDHGDWKDYQSEHGRFTVRFPSEPTEDSETIQMAGRTTLIHATTCLFRGGGFQVKYFDLPEDAEFTPIAGLKAIVEELHGTNLNIRDVKHEGHRAYEADFGAKGNLVYILLVRLDRRVYWATVEDHIEHWDYFLETLHVGVDVAKPKPAKKPSATPDRTPPKPLPPKPLLLETAAAHSYYKDAEARFGMGAEGGRKPWTWEVSGLPPGMDYNFGATASGRMESLCSVFGTPTQVGEYTLSVKVTSGDGQEQTATTKVVVSEFPDPACKLVLTGSFPKVEVPSIRDNRLVVYAGMKFDVWVQTESLVAHHFPDGSTLALADSSLPDTVTVDTSRRSFRVSGRIAEPGEYAFNVDATIQLRGYSHDVHVSREFVIEALAIPEAEWPESAGDLKCVKLAMKLNAQDNLAVTFYPTNCPFLGGPWPYKIKWEWDDEALPTGVMIFKNGSSWSLTGRADKAGEYEFTITAKVRLEGVDRDYTVSRTLTVVVG